MPGTGFVNQNTPGLLIPGRSPSPQAHDRQRKNFGYTHNRWGFTAGDDFDYQSLSVDPRHRSATIRALREYTDPPQLGGFGASQLDEWPYAARYSDDRRQPIELGTSMSRRGDRQPIPG